MIEATLEIHAPLTEVWNYLQDFKRRSLWDVRLRSVTSLTPLPLCVGSLLQYHFAWGFLRFWMEAKYIAFVPNSHSSVRFDRVSFLCLVHSAAGSWHLNATETGTEFHTKFSYRLKYGFYGRWLDRLFFRKTLENETKQSLENLKRLIENKKGEDRDVS